jgi:SAM-dependent methyltransferase
LDPHLTLAYKLAKLAPRPTTALFQTPLSGRDLQRIFEPWGWLDVSKTEQTSADVTCLASSGDQQVILDSSFPANQLDIDFVHEIAHHDFEIGGKNEWDGAPTHYGHFILRLLSRTHCREQFPNVAPQLFRLRRTLGRSLEALDIGCGPLSWLRWGALEGLLNVTGIDPLIELYEIILARHGLLALPGLLPSRRLPRTIESICGASEHREQYDFVFTNNALDHVQDIRLAIESIRWGLAPHGFAYLQVATREGTRQNWDQLHQHDIYVEDGYLVAQKRDGTVIRLCGPSCPLRLGEVLRYEPEGLTVVASKY